MPSKNQSIILGGLVIGLLSTSYLGLINMLCCAGVIIGAVISVWHYTDTNELTMAPGQGAVLGIMAGLVGFVVATILNFILIKMGIRADLAISEIVLERFGDSMPPEQYDEMVAKMNQPVTIASYLKDSWYGIIANVVFGAIGGAIGAAVFKKGGDTPNVEA